MKVDFNKKHKKNVLIIIISILIIMLIVAIIAIIVFRKKPAEITGPTIDNQGEYLQESIEEYVSDKLIPRNIYDFTKEYSGSVSRDTLYEKLYLVSRYLPDLCDGINKAKDLSSFYQANSASIEKYLGIQNYNTFEFLAEYLKEHDVSGHEVEYCSYNIGTANNTVDYCEFEMEFKYNNLDPLEFSMRLSMQDTVLRPILMTLPK